VNGPRIENEKSANVEKRSDKQFRESLLKR